MIPRAHRFHGYNSLRRVYRQGANVRGPLFAVKSVIHPGRKSYRVAVVVSRKVSKSAVARNRMRRRLYALVREIGKDIRQPHDIVITVFSDSLLTVPPAELKSQLDKQLKAAKII